jgi:hypothetical protein
MPLASEYNTRPRKIIVHNPAHTVALNTLTHAGLAEHNFTSVPDAHKLRLQYRQFIEAIHAAGIATVDLTRMLEADDRMLLNRSLHCRGTPRGRL